MMMFSKNFDPKLLQALKNWNNFAADNIKNASAVSGSITPLQDAIQLFQQISEVTRKIDWQSCCNKKVDPEAAVRAQKEWLEIQTASFTRISEGNMALLKTTLGSGKQYSDALHNVTEPQQQMAACINTSISLLKQYQDDMNNQMQGLNAIQAAYKAWFQKTFLS